RSVRVSLNLLGALEFLVHVLDVRGGEVLKREALVLLGQSELLFRLIDGETANNSLLHARTEIVEVVAEIANVGSFRHVAVTGNELGGRMIFENRIKCRDPIVHSCINQVRQSL